MDDVSPTAVTLTHPTDPGRVTIELPMDAEKFGRILQALGRLGFEFEREDGAGAAGGAESERAR